MMYTLRAGGTLHLEYLIKPRCGLGDPDDHLRGRHCPVGHSPSVADFAVAGFLPCADGAHIPRPEFPALHRRHARLNEFGARREPVPARLQTA